MRGASRAYNATSKLLNRSKAVLVCGGSKVYSPRKSVACMPLQGRGDTLMKSRKWRNNADYPGPRPSPGRSRFAKVAPWKPSPTQPPFWWVCLGDRQRHAWVEHAAHLMLKASKADDYPELIEEATRQVERAFKREGLM
jgi:hypothetical protein